jgi:hypothetical protein
MTQSFQTAKPASAQKLSPEIAEILHMLRSLETTPAPSGNLQRG